VNYGLYLSASGVLTNMYRQDVLANNLANSQTVGFKRDVATFRQRLAEAQQGAANGAYRNPLLDQIGGGAWAGPQAIDFQPGALQNTGNPLDAALTDTNAFFVVGVKDPASGQVQDRLTRDGRFTKSADGRLVTVAGGNAVLDVNGQPISLTNGGPASINSHGEVNQNGQTVGHIQVASVKDLSALTKAGSNLFQLPAAVSGGGALQTVTDPKLATGQVEGSGVDPIRELVDLMTTAKNLTYNANMIHYQDLMMDRAVNTLGHVG
jgi:flagellar basal-body rod protein FlgF